MSDDRPPFSRPPADDAPSDIPAPPPSIGKPAGGHAPPAGVVTRAASSNRSFGKGFTGTIMGTMVFIAKSRSMGTAAKVGGAILLVGGLVAGGIFYMQKQARDQAHADLSAAIEQGDEGLSRARELIGAGMADDDIVRALNFLGEHHDEASVQIMMDHLDGTLEVQQAATDGLAEIGAPAAQPAASALAGLLDAEDEALRVHAAWALARLQDDRGINVIVSGLATGDVPSLPSYDPRSLAALMGRDRLLEVLDHESASVRQFAVRNLADTCHESDEGALAGAAADSDTSVSDAAIIALARCGMPDAANTALEAVFQNGSERWNNLYTQMYSNAGAPALGSLLPFTPDEAVHARLVEEISTSLDPRASAVMLAELDRVENPSSTLRAQVARAMAFSSHTRIVEVLEPLLVAEDLDEARVAVNLLGLTEVADHGVPERLVALARERAPLRDDALHALAEVGACDEATQSATERYLTDRSRAVSTAALRSLGRCGHERAVSRAREEASRPLAGPIAESDGNYHLAALEVVARRGLSDLEEPLFEQLAANQTDARIRTAVADTLGLIAGNSVRERAQDRLLDPETSSQVRVGMRRMLASGTAETARGRLMGFVRSGAADLRTRDAATLVGLAHSSATREEQLELLASDQSAASAAHSLLLGGTAASAPALVARIRERTEVATRLSEALEYPPWVLLRGNEEQVAKHVGSVMAARNAGWGSAASAMCEMFRRPPEEIGPMEMSRTSLARFFLARLTAEDSAEEDRVVAAEVLTCMNARSAVLSVRDTRSTGSEAARTALSFIRSDTSDGAESAAEAEEGADG